MAPVNLANDLLPLALPLSDPACLYTPAQRQSILDKLYAFIDKHLSTEEHRSFNAALNACVHGTLIGVDTDGKGWEGVKIAVAKIDEVRRAESEKLSELEKAVAPKVTTVKCVAGSCPACVEAGGEAAVTPSQATDTESPKDATTRTGPPPSPPTTQKKEPFLRAFLNAVTPLCDDPATYSEEQRSTFFKTLADFFQKNLTLDEQARFSVTLDECCELSLTDPYGGNLMMKQMIHDVARERIERSVRKAQIRDIEEAMKGVEIGNKDKGKGEERGVPRGGGQGTDAAASRKGDVKPNGTATRIVRMHGSIPGAKSGAFSKVVTSAVGSAFPAGAATEPNARYKYTVGCANNGDPDGQASDTSNGTSSRTINDATTQRISSDSTTSPATTDATSPSASSPSLPGADSPHRIVKIPKILSRDLEILLSLPDPRRTNLYIRMVFEPVTSTELIMTAALQAKYSHAFCALLTQKAYDEDAARDLEDEDDRLERAKKWGGVLTEATFVGVLLRAIPGVELVINESDKDDDRLWVRGVKEREVALTFAGTNRKREKKILHHYQQTGQVGSEPKNEFARKLAEDPLFARDRTVPRADAGKMPPHYGFNRKKNAIIGGRDREDSAFPGIGLKSRTNEASLKNFVVKVSCKESGWPGVEMLGKDRHPAIGNILRKKRGLGRRGARFEVMESNGVEEVIEGSLRNGGADKKGGEKAKERKPMKRRRYLADLKHPEGHFESKLIFAFFRQARDVAEPQSYLSDRMVYHQLPDSKWIRTSSIEDSLVHVELARFIGILKHHSMDGVHHSISEGDRFVPLAEQPSLVEDV